MLAAWFVLYAFAFDAYSVFMHGRYGQTLGKMCTGVKVLDLSEAGLSFRQAFLRDIVPILLSFMVLVNGLPRVAAGLDPYPESSEFNWVDELSLYGSLVWFAAELVTMLTNARRRALHDFIAGSVVVRVRHLGTEKASDPRAA